MGDIIVAARLVKEICTLCGYCGNLHQPGKVHALWGMQHTIPVESWATLQECIEGRSRQVQMLWFVCWWPQLRL